MKKLTKLSLLGEMDLLSKAELKQLVGSRGKEVRCGDFKSKDACESGITGGDWCENGHNVSRKCIWNGSFCLCDTGPYGGITYSYSYSY